MSLKSGTTVVYSQPYKVRSYGGAAWTNGVNTVSDSYQLVSTGHPRPFGRGSGDNGGAFLLIKTESAVTPAYYNLTTFQGGILVGEPLVDVTMRKTLDGGAFASLSDSTLDSNGSTLMSRVAPTNPVAGLAEFLGDARQGLPHPSGLQLLREKSHFLKGSGSEYLNVEFGWKPLVSDLRKFAFATKNAHRIIHQYRKDAGTKIRRRSAFPTITSAKQWKGSFYPRPTAFNNWGTGTYTSTYTHDAWFAGAFKYYLPIDDTMMGKFALAESEANKLLGLRLTPDVVWELEPWSWAVDWYSNVGDVMKNISAFSHDGLVLQYGYSMASTVRTTEKVAKWHVRNGYSGPYYDATATSYIVETAKQRRPATPYGFGFDMAKLTSRQSAILVALGLSKGL